MIALRTINIPIYMGLDAKFIGFFELLKLNILPTVSLFMCIICYIFYNRFTHDISNNFTNIGKVIKTEDMSYEHLVFLATYILPFFTFDANDIRSFVSMVVLLIAIGSIYIKTEKFFTNPTLALLGFKLYKIEFKNHNQAVINMTIISKKIIKPEDTIHIRLLGENIAYGEVKDGI
ncbi:hypothetical protein EHQ58_10205 [Leptospira ognonensis]|uniref:Uncharacterized protein n=2 Tax=Leptospira ognonensis TaxID=2484945 RepID=A0A4R9K1J4_9LEPT|nr:hypothetical protein EHQ58_10205 [Leptospira ognonensis]